MPLPETHTAMILAAELRKCGLDQMADKAATGYYHDFLSPLDMPEMQLVHDLGVEARKVHEGELYEKIIKLRLDVIEGKHDANKEESDAWAASPEGQAAFRGLFDGSS